MNYKEYSRLRSIARKRIERMSAAGLMPHVRIPTVKEIKASDDPAQFMQQVKTFLETGATVTAVKSGKTKVPAVHFSPAPKIPEKPRMSEEERRARKREQNRRSKAKRAVERAAGNEAQARRHASYLKSLESVVKKWREMGVDAGNWLGILSPGKAQAFVEYLDYRFSQGDFTEQYVIDTFIKDFATLAHKDYKLSDIQKDFDAFLASRETLKDHERETNKYGVSSAEVSKLWKQFVNRDDV